MWLLLITATESGRIDTPAPPSKNLLDRIESLKGSWMHRHIINPRRT